MLSVLRHTVVWLELPVLVNVNGLKSHVLTSELRRLRGCETGTLLVWDIISPAGPCPVRLYLCAICNVTLLLLSLRWMHVKPLFCPIGVETLCDVVLLVSVN